MAVTGWNSLNDTDNIFIQGLDSLQTITAVRILRHGLDTKSISAPLVYSNPSVSNMTGAIMQLKEDELDSTRASTDKFLRERHEMLSFYQNKIDNIARSLPEISTGQGAEVKAQCVILTGSTGTCGSHLLDDLVSDPSVHHIYCLNRRPNSREAQIQSNKLRHLDANLDERRVTFLTVDLSKECFNLPWRMYEHLRNTMTVVIHAAWPVNFNMPLSSFEPQFAGVVNLISFCASAAAVEQRPWPRLFFISSISSIMHYHYRQDESASLGGGDVPTTAAAIPEKLIETTNPAENGYGESKYIAEQLLHHAVETFHPISMQQTAPIAIARVGQVGGAVKRPGLWNPSEWFPSLVMSSLHIGAVPDSLGPVLGNIDWVPVDMLSQVLLELALEPPKQKTQCSGVDVFHPHNLHSKPWHSIMPILSHELSLVLQNKAHANANGHIKNTVIETIPLDKWILRVRNDVEDQTRLGSMDTTDKLQALLKTNPAVKLLDFYETLYFQDKTARGSSGASLSSPYYMQGIFETTRAAQNDTLHTIPEVSDSWIAKWVGEWVRALR